MNKINGLDEGDIYLICCAFVHLCDDMGKIPYAWEDMYKKAFDSMELFEADYKRKLTEKTEEIFIQEREENGEEE